MKSTQTKKSLNTEIAVYNIIPSLFWSIVNLTPLAVFCYFFLSVSLNLIFSFISLLGILLPNSFLDSIQLGKTSVVYKKIGINFINKFTQNGNLINTLIRKKYPDYKVVSFKPQSLHKLLKQSYFFEKFHWILFLFFTLTTVYALTKNELMWALVLIFTNLIYNICPIFLQQYIRVRLKLFSRKKIA